MAATKEYAYWIEGDNICFAEKKAETVNGVTSEWRTIATTGLKARIYGSAIPANLSTDAVNEEISFPHFIDEACLNHIISEGYQDPRNLNPELAVMFNQKSEGMLREARKTYRRKRQRGGFIKPYDY
tara:strand:- start:25406 stop:25786 length:381 start_codon:yes stop_codon:yes gene_type:complete